MDHPKLFDAVVRELGFKNGTELVRQFGCKYASQTAWYYRRHGLPRARIADLMYLSRQRGRPFSIEVEEILVGFRAPSNKRA